MEFKRIHEKIKELEYHKNNDSITDKGSELLAELKQALQLHKTQVSGSALKLYDIEFEGVYPVGNCLVILAENEEQAKQIAEDTILHPTEIKITDVLTDKPKVIKYLSGDY